MKATGLHSHVISLLMLHFTMPLDRRLLPCAPLVCKPHLTDCPLWPPTPNLQLSETNCLVWLLTLRKKKVRPMWKDLLWVPGLIGGRGEPGTHASESLVPSCFTMLFCLHSMLHKPWSVSGRLRVELNAPTFPVKLGETNLWDGYAISNWWSWVLKQQFNYVLYSLV